MNMHNSKATEIKTHQNFGPTTQVEKFKGKSKDFLFEKILELYTGIKVTRIINQGIVQFHREERCA